MIDIKRLATDAGYWDEVAGTASHYCPANKQFYDSRLHPCCIPRPIPTKAQRDRDELKSLLEDNIRGLYCCEDGKVRAGVEDQVNAIIAAGWTKP